jgi:hypothetical protein
MAMLALILAAVPLFLAIWNMTLFRRPPLATGNPKISVLIPARNEAANIKDAVDSVLANTGVEIELIVLDDGSTDATPDILKAICDPRLRVATAEPLPKGWCGKQHACAELGKLATHDLMVFIDADVRLTPDALARMAGAMQQRPELGLASGFPRQIVGTWSEILLLPLIHFFLLGYLPIAWMNVSRLPALGAGCGQIFIARKEAYRVAGGHAAIGTFIHDGLMLPRAFRKAGQMTGLFDATDFATCRMYYSASQVWEGLTKNATEGMARPVALPIWTVILGVGQVLPIILTITQPGLMAGLALASGIGLRLVLAWRFRQPVISAILHPVGVAGVLAIQWSALVSAVQGRPVTWRGRAYTAQ